MGQRIAYFELGSRDHRVLVDFYRELFGWQVRDAGDTYTIVDTLAGSGLGGGIGRSGDGTPWASFYVQTDDPQATLDKAVSLGASVVVPVTEVPDVVTFAMFADPDGLLVGIVASGGAVGGASSPGPGSGVPVDWFEVLGSDAERTQRFYTELFGWTLNDPGFPGYRLVDTQSGEGSIGGGIGGGRAGTWAAVYARVPDVEAILAKAERLGGTRVYGPDDVDDHTRAGALRDPAGNVFGVYHHQDHG